MARKIDFTQKLLDDLRLRKEQLAMAQNSQQRGRNAATNAYESLNRSSQGSRDRNLGKTNGHGNRPNSTPKKWSSPGNHRSPVAEKSSQEIVLFEKPGRTANSFTDLSMAIAFAIENGWNFVNMDSSIAGKKVISHHLQRSLNSGEMSSSRYHSDKYRYSTNQSATPSYLQIREISKGAQKLNQILQSCYNGVNFDRYSINIGKELLKGAMDLEESLRMLVNLQAASDYMVSTRRKPVRLVEEEEEEGAIEVYRPTLMEKPRFSFDGLSRNTTLDLREIAKNGFFKHHLLALSSYSSSNSKMSKVGSDRSYQSPSPDLVSSRRSMSLDLDSRAVVSNPGTKGRNFGSKELSTPATGSSNRYINTPESKNVNKIKKLDSIKSERDKGTMPNVIAKLMGLEVLPSKSETRKSVAQKGQSSEHGAGINRILDYEIRKDVNWISKTWERPKSQIDQNKILERPKSQIETVHREGKTNQVQKNTQNLQVVSSGSQKSVFKVDQKKNTPRTEKVIESQEAKKINERTENPKTKFQNTMKNGDIMFSHAQKPILKCDLQRKMNTNRSPATADTEHKTEELSVSQYKKEQKNENDVVTRPRNPQKPVLEVESQKPYMTQKSEGQDTKPRKVEREQNSKTQPKIKRDKPAFLQLTIEKAPSGGLKEKRAYRESTDKIVAPIPPIVSMKPLQIPFSEKLETDEARTEQQEKPINIESRRRKDGSPRDVDRPIRTSKTKEAVRSSKPPLQKNAEPSAGSCNPIKNDRRNPEAAHQAMAPVSNASSHYPSRIQLQSHDMDMDMDMDTSSKISTALQLPEILLKEDMSQNSNFEAIQPKGPKNSAIIGHSHFLSQKGSHVTKSKSEYQNRPIEHESHLMQVLIKSPHFLNAAEALFKLHIPVNILHASSHKRQDGDSKLVLDCAYEIMMRKGRRRELAFHPLTKMVIVSMEVKSLDDLVKELEEDLDQIKLRGCSGSHNQDPADHMQRMLKTDIQSSDPDINCMWDISWMCTMFAEREKDEVTREVEKLIFDGLINDITRDILHTSASSFQ